MVAMLQSWFLKIRTFGMTILIIHTDFRIGGMIRLLGGGDDPDVDVEEYRMQHRIQM